MKKLTEQEAINKINKKVLEINNDLSKNSISFLGFASNWNGVEKTKLILKCNKHNIINEKTYKSFIKEGWQCKKCHNEHLSKIKTLTPIEAQLNLENKYKNDIRNYDFLLVLSTFTSIYSKITIICPIHGKFEVTYEIAIRSKWVGCPKCRKDISITNALNKISNFINKNPNIEFIGFLNNRWIGNKTRLILKCKKHNYIWNTSLYSSIANNQITIGCPKCRSERLSDRNKLSPQEALDYAKKRRIDLINQGYNLNKILYTYKSFVESVKIDCPIHGEVEVNYGRLVCANANCPLCAPEILKLKLRTPKEIVKDNILNRIEYLNNKYNSNICFVGFINDSYTGSKTKLVLECKNHNIIWKTTCVGDLLNKDGVYCPECSKNSRISISEKYCYENILIFVDKYRIESQYELNIYDQILKRFRTIYVDFYIKLEDTILIIEFDGKQHTEFISFFHKNYEEFVDQVNRDNLLKQYCLNNNIKLVNIRDIDINRIFEILSKLFSNGEDITTKVEPKLLPIPYGKNIIS